jgi:predicted outer membrane protein
MALARWLVTDQRLHSEISTFAQQRAHNPQVKQFATSVAQSHSDLLQRLQQLAAVTPGAAQQAGQLDETLQDLGETLQGRLQQQPLARDAARARRQEIREERLEDQEAREERPDRRLLNRLDRDRSDDSRADDESNDVDQPLRDQIRERREERLETAEDREALRDERRQALRGFLRENLPEVLDVVGQALEEEAQQTVNSPWLRFHQQLGQQKSASLREELGRYQGADFDQAFLGYQILAHIEMIDSLKLAQQTATEQLRQTLADGILSAEEHLQNARQLMQQISSGGGNRTRSG